MEKGPKHKRLQDGLCQYRLRTSLGNTTTNNGECVMRFRSAVSLFTAVFLLGTVFSFYPLKQDEAIGHEIQKNAEHVIFLRSLVLTGKLRNACRKTCGIVRNMFNNNVLKDLPMAA